MFCDGLHKKEGNCNRVRKIARDLNLPSYPKTSLCGAFTATRVPGPAVRIGKENTSIAVETGSGSSRTIAPRRREKRVEAKESGEKKSEERSGNQKRAQIGIEKKLMRQKSGWGEVRG
jgi:hypothetical protein